MSYPVFFGLYLLLDWLSYIDPLFGLNITPWNPDPALGLVFWLRMGSRAALPWFGALVAGDLLVRGMPAGLGPTILTSLWLVLCYGAMGEALRRRFGSGDIFDTRRSMLTWLGIVCAGTLANAVGFITILSLCGELPQGAALLALFRFSVGDIVGIVVSMPLVWLLATSTGRERLRSTVWRIETLGYLSLAALMLWTVFGPFANPVFRHFYFLFIPLLWAGYRHGLCGTSLLVFVLQFATMILVRAGVVGGRDIYELQMLDAVMALVSLFVGIVIDELRQLQDELKQSLRLAAAGEMAGAIAHELNQPMTALSVYGKACEHLLDKGDNNPMLRDAIQRMITEANRAADVVRHVREFFRSGAMQLELVSVDALLAHAREQFDSQCEQQGVALVVAPSPAVRVKADRLQIELVLRNLVANAFDAVQAREPGARQVELSCELLPGRQVCVSVRDNGTGVSDTSAARLFEPFVSSKASGLGLGLALSRNIIEAHGGRLWAEPGAQGVFRFALPGAVLGEAHG